MSKVIIAEGKTTNEAIENGLKELNAQRNQVEINVLENEKRSFFDILAPKIVKVELTLKENTYEKEKDNLSDQDLEDIKDKLEGFLNVFLQKVEKEAKYEILIKDKEIHVNINAENSGCLIGYRGDTLNSLQTILSAVANKNRTSRARVFLNVNNYKEKREKALEELAVKVSKTVLRTSKKITLEPMNSYERKIIHNKLQDVKDIRTHSIGEEPNRRIIIEKINN